MSSEPMIAEIRSQRLRCGEPYPFGSSDLRGFRKIRGRFPRHLAAGRDIDDCRAGENGGGDQCELLTDDERRWHGN
jgi:hypothetical protein